MSAPPEACTVFSLAMGMHGAKVVGVGLITLVLTSGTHTARAQSRSPTARESAAVDTEAAELRGRANAAMNSGRPADALKAYERVYELTRNPAMLYNMARAQQALTNYPLAEDLLRQFKAEAPPAVLEKVGNLDGILEEVVTRIHTLTLQARVVGAEVRVGGRVVGTTPLAKPLRINAGDTQVDVQAHGFVPFSRRLDLRGGTASTLDVELLRIDDSGVLSVRSPQAGASVDLDGHPAGNVPLEVTLGSGPHEVLLTKPGFKQTKSKVLVVAGERKDLVVELPTVTPSLFTRWWFWTGAVVVVAGGVATYVALTTEKPAPTGSIPPGQVSTGLHF